VKNFIFFLLIISLNSYSQEYNGKVIYKIKSNSENYLNNIKNDTSLSQHIKKGIIKDFSLNKPVNFILYIDKNESIYKAEIDTQTRLKLGDNAMNVTSIMAGDSYVYYTNLLTGQLLFQSSYFPDLLINSDTINWEFTGEVKKIGKYMCHEAIAYSVSDQFSGLKVIRPVVAWYAPDIPLKFGIGGFSGLSGLIIEMLVHYETGTLSYSAIDIAIKSNDEIVIEKPTGKKMFTQQEYINYVKKIRGSH